jgi:hypothetical protein
MFKIVAKNECLMPCVKIFLKAFILLKCRQLHCISSFDNSTAIYTYNLKPLHTPWQVSNPGSSVCRRTRWPLCHAARAGSWLLFYLTEKFPEDNFQHQKYIKTQQSTLRLFQFHHKKIDAFSFILYILVHLLTYVLSSIHNSNAMIKYITLYTLSGIEPTIFGY